MESEGQDIQMSRGVNKPSSSEPTLLSLIYFGNHVNYEQADWIESKLKLFDNLTSIRIEVFDSDK